MDFKFLKSEKANKWVILDPRRSKRPDETEEKITFCPFCPGGERGENEVYRIGGEENDPNWQIRVVENKYPFAPIHEVIIHSPDHHKNFGELPVSQEELIIETYKQRFNVHQDKGQVYIFQNHGEDAGESLPHPHTQLVVIPKNIELGIRPLEDYSEDENVDLGQFTIFAPETSEWPDEIWIAPKARNIFFGQARDQEIKELSAILHRLIVALGERLKPEFPYNWYIYPGKDWYLRIIPRITILGGFEVGTGVHVNQGDPKETLSFLKENL